MAPLLGLLRPRTGPGPRPESPHVIIIGTALSSGERTIWYNQYLPRYPLCSSSQLATNSRSHDIRLQGSFIQHVFQTVRASRVRKASSERRQQRRDEAPTKTFQRVHSPPENKRITICNEQLVKAWDRLSTLTVKPRRGM